MSCVGLEWKVAGFGELIYVPECWRNDIFAVHLLGKQLFCFELLNALEKFTVQPEGQQPHSSLFLQI